MQSFHQKGISNRPLVMPFGDDLSNASSAKSGKSALRSLWVCFCATENQTATASTRIIRIQRIVGMQSFHQKKTSQIDPL
jgi:hypothetical protein